MNNETFDRIMHVLDLIDFYLYKVAGKVFTFADEFYGQEAANDD